MSVRTRNHILVKTIKLVILLGFFSLCSIFNQPALSQSKKYSAKVQTLGSIKIASSTTERDASQGVVLFPLDLPGNSSVSIIASSGLREVIKPVALTLQQSQQRFLQLFNDIPAFKSNVRLMDEASFYKRTGAPAWTNAMYYHGEIIIPVSEKFDMETLKRSLKHEFSHAVIHALSDGKCPGWLDEGFAQWAEGAENPGLKPALLDWLTSNNPVPISALQTGFTRLNPSMVPAAYAQSLFATNLVTQTYGFSAFGRYLEKLRNGDSKDQAFLRAFGVNQDSFEEKLGKQLSHWHRKHNHHKH